MEIHDLIPLLRAYPEYQKRLVDLMTDEQLEAWADVLEAEYERKGQLSAGTAAIHCIHGEWSRCELEAEVPPSRESVVASETPLGNPQPTDNLIPAMTSEELTSRADVQSALEELRMHVDAGHANANLIATWQRFINQHVQPANRPDTLDDAPLVGHLEAKISNVATQQLRQFLESMEAHIVPSLGKDVAAVLLISPWRQWVVVGQDAIHDALEAEFIVCRAYLDGQLHGLQGELPLTRFAFWLEFKKDSLLQRQRLSDLNNREASIRINNVVTCLLYDEYVDNLTFEESKPLMRQAISRNVAQIPLLRTIFRERGMLRQGIRDLYSRELIPRQIANAAKPSLLFREHVAIVRQHWWSPVYLIWADPDGRWLKRWIPSRKVVYALGLRMSYIPSISETLLAKHEDDGILISPEQVRQVREMLSRNEITTISLLPRPSLWGIRSPAICKERSPLNLSQGPRQRHLRFVARERQADSDLPIIIEGYRSYRPSGLL